MFESYRQFKQILGDNFTTIYDIDQRQLTAVVCRQVGSLRPASGVDLAAAAADALPTSADATTLLPVPGPAASCRSDGAADLFRPTVVGGACPVARSRPGRGTRAGSG